MGRHSSAFVMIYANLCITERMTALKPALLASSVIIGKGNAPFRARIYFWTLFIGHDILIHIIIK